MEILSFCFFGAMWSAFGAFFLPLLNLRNLRDPRVIVLEGNLAKVNKILVKDPRTAFCKIWKGLVVINQLKSLIYLHVQNF